MFFGQRDNARDFEHPFRITKVDFVHGAQFQQGAFRREVRRAQAILKQGQQQVGEVANKDMGVDVLGQPMADRPQLGDSLETAEGLFHDVFVKVERKHLVLGEPAGAEDAGVTIKLFGLGQLGWQQMAAPIKESLQARFDAFALGQELCSVPRFFRELFPFGFVVKREAMARC